MGNGINSNEALLYTMSAMYKSMETRIGKTLYYDKSTGGRISDKKRAELRKKRKKK